MCTYEAGHIPTNCGGKKKPSSVLSDFSGNCSSVYGQRFSPISHCHFTGMQAPWDQDFVRVFAPFVGISQVPGMVPCAY